MHPAEQAADGIREIILDASGTPISALLAEPPHPPRAVVLAVHGGGMRAGYFHGRSTEDQSLLSLGAKLGFTVLAVDRPGYGRSADHLPHGLSLADQTDTLADALHEFARTRPVGAGIFVLAHSYGGKLALSTAARRPDLDLLGLEISGCAEQFAPGVRQFLEDPDRRPWWLHWGPPHLYPPGTFEQAREMVALAPLREVEEATEWPETFARLAPAVAVPVHFTFAEHEKWWRHDEVALRSIADRLSAAPRVEVHRHPGAGHNISLGQTARSYHLKALSVAEQCIAERELAHLGKPRPEPLVTSAE
ncbi:alpha/beta hydrolase [Saccharopolyspora taberi]|uniref:Alpha/beta hydrolase n=1 Tax=Saccharopolyspora taberi TaxID=60895 RepID=A0ABN3VBP4_9PSEU